MKAIQITQKHNYYFVNILRCFDDHQMSTHIKGANLERSLMLTALYENTEDPPPLSLLRTCLLGVRHDPGGEGEMVLT